MLTLDEARERSLAGARRVSSERVALCEALGRVLAEPLVARGSLPPFDHSAMDGFAVATADFARGEGPWRFPVAGESSAGSIPAPLAPSSACRIFTGAAIPRGADAVIPQENVDREEGAVRLAQRPKAGQHIRRAGEDLKEGAVALARGTRMTAGALALAAMLDEVQVTVARAPRVAILCTGSEVRPPGAGGGPATIADSNGVALAALARQAGAVAALAPIVGDDPRRVAQAIDDALAASDLLVTVGGVSVGDHDLVRPAFAEVGVVLDFWKVAIKPGKPIAFGRRGGAHVIGLPGNPASAIVTFALFGMPLLRSMQGDAKVEPLPIAACLASSRRRSRDRLELVRATLRRENGAIVAHPHDNQASGAATSLALSDGIAIVPAGEAPIEAGALVDVLRWSDF